MAPDQAGPKPVPKRRRVTPFITRATRAELVKAGRLDTWAGRSAMLLAERLDASGSETGAAVAALTEQHSRAMARALEEAAPGDPIAARRDEVAERREQHRRGAG